LNRYGIRVTAYNETSWFPTAQAFPEIRNVAAHTAFLDGNGLPLGSIVWWLRNPTCRSSNDDSSRGSARLARMPRRAGSWRANWARRLDDGSLAILKNCRQKNGRLVANRDQPAFVISVSYFFGGGSVGHAGRRTSSSPRTGRTLESITGVRAIGGGGIGGAGIGVACDVAIGKSFGLRSVAKPRSGWAVGLLFEAAEAGGGAGIGSGLRVWAPVVSTDFELRPTATGALSLAGELSRSSGVLVTGAFGPGSGSVSVTVGNARQWVWK